MKDKAVKVHAWLSSEQGQKEIDILRSRYQLSEHFNITYALLRTGIKIDAPEDIAEIQGEVRKLRKKNRPMRGLVVALALCCLFTACAACAPVRPDICILGIEIVQGSQTQYAVTYAINGNLTEKSFSSFDEADRYIKYLLEIGGKSSLQCFP